MKIIISPAKKMNIREDELDTAGLPCFLSKAEELKEYIRSLSFEEAKELWACNEAIARLNFGRFAYMDLKKRLTPALLSYEGIQYQYMAPGVFEKSEWEYVQKHLRILSGFYGVLRPLDGIVPYRLEMQAKVALPGGVKGLYDFWGSTLFEKLLEGEDEDPVIVNLASKEYSKAVEPYLTPDTTFLTCIFGNLTEDRSGKQKVRVKATEAKMARGEMVRFMAAKQVEKTEELKAFDGLGYKFHEELSKEKEFVFVKS